MIKQAFFSILIKLLPSYSAYAHCDVPCGIYDPHQAQLAAHTVIRMTEMINEMHVSSENPSFDERKKIIHQIARLTKVKEDHAEIVKHEIRVLWGDYFKEEHFLQYKDLSPLIYKSMKLASKARLDINLDTARELLETVQKIAEIFYKTKNREPVRIASVYPTGGVMVYPK